MVGGLFGMFFLGVLYLQRVLGYDAIEIGLAFLPVSLGIGILSLGFSARLVMRFGPRAVLLAGLRLDRRRARAVLPGARRRRYVTDVLPAMVLIGVGGGLSFPALMALAMTGATPEDSGLLSGLVNTTQQVGGGARAGGAGHAGDARAATACSRGGDGQAAALTGGYTLAFGVAAGFLVAAFAIAATVLRRPAEEPAAAAAAEPAYSEV